MVAAIAAIMSVKTKIMVIIAQLLQQHKKTSKQEKRERKTHIDNTEKGNRRKNFCHQIWTIVFSQNIQSIKLPIQHKAKCFRLNLNVKDKNESFLVKLHIMKITILNVLLQKNRKRCGTKFYNNAAHNNTTNCWGCKK